MDYIDESTISNIRIAYIGGGSRGWGWGLMSDLVSSPGISGEVLLYDIDPAAAKNNEIIGNLYNRAEGAVTHWNYRAVPTLDAALTGADFVVISILPGTFDEMQSDVHTPEEYGIYQSVGDTTGPGGIIRALRTIPMFEVIADGIRRCCPDAWVINYTNPMTVCTRTLYRTFPAVKAFGCCHEVFGTQTLLSCALNRLRRLERVPREEIQVNVVGVNHFTWLTSAHYRSMDLFPLYREFCGVCGDDGYNMQADTNWMNSSFRTLEKVKMDLFRRYGLIAAAGDRHLAEFCPGNWYLRDPETVDRWGFALTPVDWRRADLKLRLEKSRALLSGEKKPVIENTGEDGVRQIRAILGLSPLRTNVNLPNAGQIPNLPLGAVVETNADFSADCVSPVLSGEIPRAVYSLISRICGEQETIVEAGISRDLSLAFNAFLGDPLVGISMERARELFNRMVANTSGYLGMYGRHLSV